MKVELDLYSPAELEAFATFCTAVATHSRERNKADVDRKEDASYSVLVGQTTKGSTAVEALNPIKVPDEPITDQQAEALVADAKTASETPVRERGKPSPGHARRTKAEIAEDDAADAAEAALKKAGEETGAVVADKHVEERGNISESPEDRVDPNNPEDGARDGDSAEDAAQDAADEAAETASAKAANGGKLTLDDVRKGLGEYVKLYGMPAAQEDGPKLIQKVMGDDAKVKISDLPDDQAVLAKAVAGTKELCEKNPFKRAKVA